MLRVVLSLLLLNFLATFVNVWPTPYVRPDTRIGPEFVLAWVVLLALVAFYGKLGRIAISIFTTVFVLIAIGRYVDVTVPAWLGRKLNLYWDGPQLPTFIDVASQSFAWWQIGIIIAAFVFGFWLLVRLIRAALVTLAVDAAPYAIRSPMALLATAIVVALVIGNMTQIVPSRFVAGPVFPVYQRQADLLLTPLIPSRLAKVLPPAPSLESDLKVLGGADVEVLFLESYGATTYDNPAIVEAIAPARERLAIAAEEQGRFVLSSFVRAATFGGASDLSHLSLLSGTDLTDPLRHDLLLATDRQTILDTFESHGYRTIGLYPSMSWDWPEKSFYSFDHYYDGPSLDYRGPKFGLWWLPDQFSIARINELYPPTADSRPRFLFFPTINSHIPYRPRPPYQADWSKVTSNEPFTAAATAAALADEIDWDDLLTGYLATVEYTFEWLEGYVRQPRQRDKVLVLIGDHQPAGGIVRPGANWDVPVHIITSNPVIAERLRTHGFADGIVPVRREAIGHISDLTGILLSTFDSDGGSTMVAARKLQEAKS
jgi:hypothetical protein